MATHRANRLKEFIARYARGDDEAERRQYVIKAGITKGRLSQMEGDGFGERAGEALAKKLGLADLRWFELPDGTPPARNAATSKLYKLHGSLDELPSRMASPLPGVSSEPSHADYAGPLNPGRGAAVMVTARVMANGAFESIAHPQADGWVPSSSQDPEVYAVRVKGDALFPSLRDGVYLIVEPRAKPQSGEKVLLQMHDGRQLVKILLFERHDSITVEPVNGGQQETMERADIEAIHAIGGTVEASRWRKD